MGLDTIDLQDHTSPSAKDHTRQPTHPAALGAGPAAPHQAETLREVAAEAEELQTRSPRVSGEWHIGSESIGAGSDRGGDSLLTGANLQQQDSLANSQNGRQVGSITEDSDMADGEGDDMDDDMMDKISSSPSIDDGGCSLPKPRTWPARIDSLGQHPISQLSSPFSHGSSERSSSPSVSMDDSVHYPLLSMQLVDPGPNLQDSLNHHHLLLPTGEGEYRKFDDSMMIELDEMLDELDGILPAAPIDQLLDDDLTGNDDIIDQAELADIEAELERIEEIIAQQEDQESDVDEYDDYDDEQFTVPYESSDEEDDDETPFPEDPRFIDSGWGGECLQDLEDIDFEFVYALHTFVATVEGQANATKGDTMVLLDDSNSYWWLVRVVKDSSIGT